MLEKSLPITVAPIDGECLTSFLMRSAAVYGVSAERLIQHCLPGQGAKTSVSADTLTIDPDGNILAALAKSLRVSLDDLQAMTLPAHLLSISPGAIAFSGAARDPDTLEIAPSQKLRFGWCPLCLMEDRAGGGDHFLRLDWPLAFVTMCPTHKRPLIERCQNCYHFVGNPDYALYRDQMALICPRCFTPLDARLGYDFVANQHAHDWNDDATLQMVWDQIINYEQFFLKKMRQRAGRSKKQRLITEIHGLLDLLLRAEKPNDLRPVDVLDSAYFPSPAKLGFSTRQLSQPFHICHLVERRKALAIVICMLEDKVDAFGFESGAAPMHRLREFMYRDTYDQFERHILNIARLALPI